MVVAVAVSVAAAVSSAVELDVVPLPFFFSSTAAEVVVTAVELVEDLALPFFPAGGAGGGGALAVAFDVSVEVELTPLSDPPFCLALALLASFSVAEDCAGAGAG